MNGEERNALDQRSRALQHQNDYTALTIKNV